jgi:death-on-curing protein
METISYHLAAGRIDKDFLREIIDSLVYEEDFSEVIKLKLIHCMSDKNYDE